MCEMLGADAVLPSPEYLNQKYLDTLETDWRMRLDLIACASNISACYDRLGEPLEARCWYVTVAHSADASSADD